MTLLQKLTLPGVPEIEIFFIQEGDWKHVSARYPEQGSLLEFTFDGNPKLPTVCFYVPVRNRGVIVAALCQPPAQVLRNIVSEIRLLATAPQFTGLQHLIDMNYAYELPSEIVNGFKDYDVVNHTPYHKQ
jgi:hypothetical protein